MDERDLRTEEVARAEIDLGSLGLPDDAALDALNARLAEIEDDLNRYTCDADRLDYAIAVFSGLISAGLDSVFVGEIDFEKEVEISHEKVNRFIQSYAGMKDGRLKVAIGNLESKYKVPQDGIYNKAGIDVGARNHHLADLAHHPTPVGFLAALFVQFFRAGVFVNKKGEWHLVRVDTSPAELAQIYAPLVITAFLNWIVALSEQLYQEEYAEQIPESMRRLAKLVASAPVIVEVARCANNWVGHLVSDMAGSKNTAGKGMGIPGVFMSLMYEIASLPGLKDTGLLQVINDIYSKQRVNLRHEVAVVDIVAKQAVPVLLNEVIVRLSFFLGRLAREYASNGGLEGIDWTRVVPFDNRTVDRMLAVSTMTFSTADIADAAVRAAMECEANWLIFSKKMVARVNYVGAGRAVIAVVKEVNNESKECRLLHEKMLLSQEKAGILAGQAFEFGERLDRTLSEYLLSNLEASASGLADMDAGLADGNADLVIGGSVTIQSALGHESQFTTAEEFDDLMESDDDFVL